MSELEEEEEEKEEEEKEEEEKEEEEKEEEENAIPPDQWDLPIGFDSSSGLPITLKNYKDEIRSNKFRVLNLREGNNKDSKRLAIMRLKNVKVYGDTVISDEVITKDRAIKEIETETRLGEYLIEVEKESIRIMMDEIDNEEGTTNQKKNPQ